jgi:hypothetical protein
MTFSTPSSTLGVPSATDDARQKYNSFIQTHKQKKRVLQVLVVPT